ncbi:MAG TPA: carbon-nitrogen hydrolase family protein [Gemmataceae bacterium]|nr:carbon-nitrogen hydrolase family protein [Gemmataceae bacterium]
MAHTTRLAAVSYAPPPHDHRRQGVNLGPLREIVLRVAKDKADFICFPEICACSGGGLARGVERAPELEPFVAEVGKLAREVNAALVVPLLERYMGQVYNSVPVVDRSGKLVLTYRKNYPTTGEMDAGVTPGWEVPVAVCDGVRVGAAVCFDVNFPQVAAELERQRARLVFWPSMFWGGQLLQHWALRYGFYIVAAFTPESAVIDMNGRYLTRQGADTSQVRGGRLPPWAIAEVNVDRELFHLDFNQDKFPALRGKYGPDIDIEVHQPEAFFLLASKRTGLNVETIAKEFQLETLRDYLARSVQQREQHLRGHAQSEKRPEK